jgi:hypothetical protein
MREALYKMMGDRFKGVQYAMFPKTIIYKGSKDGAKMTTNGITLQVTKTLGITAADFRGDMAENWQRMTMKSRGGSLWDLFYPVWKRKRHRRRYATCAVTF